MKISKHLALGLLAISLMPVFGQPAGTIVLSGAVGQQSQLPALTKFNLDFPGGTPAQLVKAIERPMGKPLNAIIPDEAAGIKLPPLKMGNVDVVQLFAALGAASVKQENRITSTSFNGIYGGSGSYATVNTGYGFKTDGNPSDDSIWYFYVQNPPPAPNFSPPTPAPAKVCRFYQLQPYLNSGLTVDDITTAIQTGWKMSGDASVPELNYHKETKLLIAFGEPDKLEVIENVLKALQPPPPNPTTDFQERLQRIIKNQPPISPPTAVRPPLSPEDQVNLIEQNRRNSQRPSTNLPPPVKPEAGQ